MNYVIHVSPSADGSDCLHTNTLPEWRVLYVYRSVVNILEVKVYTHTHTHTHTHKIQYMVVGICTSTHIAFHHTIQIPLGV